MHESAWVYILRCSDNSYYTGCTTDLASRIGQHNMGQYDGYTASRRPIELVFSQEFTDIYDAIHAERQIKGWSRAKKEALMRGDFELLHALARSTERKRRIA